MKPHICTCGETIPPDQLGLGRWSMCPKCGREHGLIRPSGLPACIVVGLLALVCGLFAAGQIEAPAAVPEGVLPRFAATALALLLGTYSLVLGFTFFFNYGGIPEERESAISRMMADFQSGLTAVVESGDPTEVAQKTLKHCRSALKSLDEFPALPALGYWTKAQATAASGAAAHRLGQSKQAAEFLNQLSEFPKPRAKAYWTAWFYSQTSDRSSAAVRAYLRILKTPQKSGDQKFRHEIVAALEQACQVTSEHASAESKQKIVWNQEAAKHLPEETWPRLNEAQAFLNLRQYGKATAALGSLADDSDNWRAQLVLFQAELGEGLQSRSQNRLQSLQSKAAEHPQLAFELARYFLNQNELKEAEPLLLMLTESESSFSHEGIHLHARYLWVTERHREAQELLEGAIESGKANGDIAVLLAEMFLKTNNTKEGENVLWKAVRSYPESATVRVAWGRHQFNSEEYADSADAFDTAVKLGAASDEFALCRGRCLLRLGKADEAASILDQAALITGKEAMRIAFYHGVAIYEQAGAGDGTAAARALPFFAKAAREAKERNDRDLLKRAKINSLNCLRSIAEHSFVSGKYDESARAWRQLSKSLKTGHDTARHATGNAAESYLRAGIKQIADARYSNAVPHLEAAVQLRPTGVMRVMLGTTYFAAGDYTQAESTFAALLAENETDERVLYYRALSAARKGDSDGRKALQTLQESSLRFRTRSALAQADLAGDAGDAATGASVLKAVLFDETGAVSDLKNDRYFGECCCRLALFTVRMGKADEAEEQIRLLLSEDVNNAGKILGAILAEVGDYQSALTTLERYVSGGQAEESVKRLLSGVAVRLAVNLCEAEDYAAANQALLSGQCDANPADYSQLLQLVSAASEDISFDVGARGQTLQILERCIRESKEMAAISSRPVFIGRLMEADGFAQARSFDEAQKSAAKAAAIWDTKIRKSPGFWNRHIQSFNEGKEHQLQLKPKQLAAEVEQRLIGFWVLGIQKSCYGGEQDEYSIDTGLPEYEGITFYWQSLVNFVGQARAESLVREHLNTEEIFTRVARTVSEDEAVRFAKFFRTAVYADEKLAAVTENAAKKCALEALGRFDCNAFRSALNEYFAVAASSSEDHKLLVKVKNLTHAQQKRVIELMSTDRQLGAIQTLQPQMFQMICLGILMNFAELANSVPGGLRLSQISQVYEQVSSVVITGALKVG